MSASDRGHLLGLHGDVSADARRATPTYGATGGASALSAQRAAFAEQEAALDALAVGVRSVRGAAAAVAIEVGEQNRALDGLAESVSRADDRVGRAAGRTAASEKSPYSVGNFCFLLWPLVLLIVLVVVAIRHLLFR
jgi:hypothetical protein